MNEHISLQLINLKKEKKRKEITLGFASESFGQTPVAAIAATKSASPIWIEETQATKKKGANFLIQTYIRVSNQNTTSTSTYLRLCSR